jgi:hypothetical protein
VRGGASAQHSRGTRARRSGGGNGPRRGKGVILTPRGAHKKDEKL